MASSLRLRGNAFLKSVGFYAVLCCAVFLCFQEKKRKQHNRMISLWNREKSYAEAVKFYTQAIKARLAEGRKMLIFALAIASGNSASILRSYLVQIDLNQWTRFLFMSIRLFMVHLNSREDRFGSRALYTLSLSVLLWSLPSSSWSAVECTNYTEK